VVGSFTALNLVLIATTLITGPVQARALGPGGRGDLAAIAQPLALALGLADVGLSTYVLREVARGRPAREVLGGVAPLALAFGCVIAIAGPLIASFIANGRDTVHLFLVIGFALMPVTLLMKLLLYVNWARERWTIVAVVRAIPPVGTLVAALVLYATGRLTVAAMASLALALGLLASLPLLGSLRMLGRPRWSRAVAAQGLSFGSRAWLDSLATLVNVQVDQVIMSRAVSPAELGFYAVAVNVTAVSQSLAAAVVGVVMPRVAAGDS
jgi:O-antigen/teichoic acid export membrane protein